MQRTTGCNRAETCGHALKHGVTIAGAARFAQPRD